ncbi:hypothetical protein E2562_028908 [Oryza meyeriana var. granulata]|uniref:Uncharacterized protein n=1 Tax=Oryza meyeriana var. granulata TaxID=110450 RepID=A0A6G1FDN2_9ORYZ|nr:hypothetical protein E2562_028908 [Oryza meyeriana var. granulata]
MPRNPADPRPCHAAVGPLDQVRRRQVNPPAPLDAHWFDALTPLDRWADAVPTKAIKAEELRCPSPPTSAPLRHQPIFLTARRFPPVTQVALRTARLQPPAAPPTSHHLRCP